ncbi:MAG TPA: cyclic nucleotide-binding domain-containing protein [Gaiellaceae bacterium]|nr:cyclic nucleotide-binding domain-containing protein [Gaiellaceae bacterium]
MAVGSDLVQSLAGVPLFADLSRPQLEEVAHTFEEEIVPEGQRVLRQGLSGSNVYVILEGEAAVILNGEEIARLTRGDFFGEVSVLLGEPPTADVAARTPLRLIVIPGPQLRDFLLRHPKVMFQMLRTVTLRLRNTLAWQG